MSRRGGTRWLLAAAAIIGALAGTAAHAADRPSIVFVITDDMRTDEIKALPRTQALLRSVGTSFTRAYVSVALCCPSRSTILTGRYPQNTGVYNNKGPEGGFSAFRAAGNENRTVAVWLQAAGYRTAMIGKYLNGYQSAPDYVPPGWSYWLANYNSAAKGFDYALNENGTRLRFGSAPEDYSGDVYTRKALSFVDRAISDDVPFFLYLSYDAPHVPTVPAPRHKNLFPNEQVPRTAAFLETWVGDKPPFYRLPAPTQGQIDQLDAHYRDRLRTLRHVDEAVDALVAKIQGAGRMGETYFVFTSDHGYRLGEHRLGSGKYTAFEQDIRVPLLIRGPGATGERKVAALTGNADLAPTFASWAGVSPPVSVDGRSIAGWLSDATRPATWRRVLPIAFKPDVDPQAAAVADDTPDKVPSVTPPAYQGLRARDFTFVDYTTGDRELYDTAGDPGQLYNLGRSADPELIAALARRNAALATCAGPTCATLENAPLPSVGRR